MEPRNNENNNATKKTTIKRSFRQQKIEEKRKTTTQLNEKLSEFIPKAKPEKTAPEPTTLRFCGNKTIVDGKRFCTKSHETIPHVKFSRCSKCKGLYYCSKECQVMHYPEHKKDCYESGLLTVNSAMMKRKACSTFDEETKGETFEKGFGYFAKNPIHPGDIIDSQKPLFGIHSLQHITMDSKMIHTEDPIHFLGFKTTDDFYVRMTHICLKMYPEIIYFFPRGSIYMEDGQDVNVILDVLYNQNYPRKVSKTDILACYEAMKRYARYITDMDSFMMMYVAPNFYSLNHDCTPNAKLYYQKDKIHLVALGEIGEGEEITIHYSDYSPMNVLQRHELIIKAHHFSCLCLTCEREKIEFGKECDKLGKTEDEQSMELKIVLGAAQDIIKKLPTSAFNYLLGYIETIIRNVELKDLTPDVLSQKKSVFYQLLRELFTTMMNCGDILKMLRCNFGNENPDMLCKFVTFIASALSVIDEGCFQHREIMMAYMSCPFFVASAVVLNYLSLFINGDLLGKENVDIFMKSLSNFSPLVTDGITNFLKYINDWMAGHRLIFLQHNSMYYDMHELMCMKNPQWIVWLKIFTRKLKPTEKVKTEKPEDVPLEKIEKSENILKEDSDHIEENQV